MTPDTVLDLVGDIYDCAIAPQLWPETIRKISEGFNAVSGGIVLFDYNGGQDRLLIRDSRAPTASDIGFESLLAHVKQFQRPILGLPKDAIDEPILMPSFSEHEDELRRSRFFRQWAEVQGIHQTLQSVALLEPTRLAIFGVNRHIDQGPFAAAELGLMRRLAPHIRRSFIISDLLGLHTAERNSFSAVLETIAKGIFIVGNAGVLLHANAAAKSLMEQKTLIKLEQGQLQAVDTAATAELLSAVRAARERSTAIGATGIGIPLRGPKNQFAIAHVLPLAYGDIRPRLLPQAHAAVFITLGGPTRFDDLNAIVRSFEFTPAEARLVEQILNGSTVKEAAVALKVSETTIKTHLSHVFMKTGVSRQLDLVNLLQRLLPAARQPV
jgi:DNA-binding CsgD family transcriptional regulator/PAS domain-containing protein